MATTNLGRVKPIHRGVYDPDFPYTPLDIVRYQGASYFCIKASQGNVPQDGEFFMAIVDGDIRYAQTAGGADANFTEAPQIDGQSLDDRYQQQESGKGLSTNDYTDNEKAKLEGIESAATKNDTDAQLRDRSTHTGTQTLDTISDAGSAAAANVEAFDPAGSAAQALASAKGYTESYADPAGSAADAIASHEQAQNPHPQYARLSESNDFAHMPTVGGAPVVENGSNSDGEWTKWADGTLAQRGEASGADGGAAIKNLPIQFFDSSYSVAGQYVTSITDNPIVIKISSLAASSFLGGVLETGGSDYGPRFLNNKYRWFAIGRWK